jgi:hypothetical protein
MRTVDIEDYGYLNEMRKKCYFVSRSTNGKTDDGNLVTFMNT